MALMFSKWSSNAPASREERGDAISFIVRQGHAAEIGVEHQKVTGADAREVPAARVDQKARAVRRDGQAQVIGDGFVHVQPREPAKRRGQIDTLGAMGTWGAQAISSELPHNRARENDAPGARSGSGYAHR